MADPATPDNSPAPTNQHDPAGGRGRGNRNRNRGNRNGQRKPAATNQKTSVFKGNTEAMNGHVFQCHGEKVDRQQFTKTVKALEAHINKTFEVPQDIAPICATFTLPMLSPPPNLSATEYKEDMAKKMIWETKMKTYLKRVDIQ
jgi:hypothetical protein